MERDMPDARLDFASYVRDRCGASRAEFVQSCGMPLLVQLGAHEQQPAASWTGFSTLMMDRRALLQREEPIFVHPLRKSGANPFAMITIGRAPNNDIVLTYDEISK